MAISNLPAGAPAPSQGAGDGWEPVPATPAQSAPTTPASPATNDGWEPVPTQTTQPTGSTSIASSPSDDYVRGALSPTEGLDRLKGFGHGAAATAAGAMDLADKVTGGDPATDSSNPDAFTQTRDWLKAHSENTGTTPEEKDAQDIGYGGETLTEYLSGEWLAKGVPLAKALEYTSNILKTVETSPRVMSALKLGAAVLKAGATLSPEEAAMIKAHPVIAKLVGLGHQALLAATTQTGQTFVRSGGDASEAVKNGAIQGASVGLGEGVLGAAGTMAGKLGKAGKTAAELAETAASAPSEQTITQHIQGQLANAEDHLHTNYENQTNDFVDRLDGSQIDAKEAPIASKAADILEKPDPEDHSFVQQAGEARGQMLDTKVRSLLENIAEGKKPLTDENIEAAEKANKNKPTILDAKGKAIESEDVEPEADDAEPYDARSIIKLRQEIRALAAQYPIGDVNARALKRLLWDAADKSGTPSAAFDDTFSQLADQSSDPDVADEYKALRNDYRNKISRYDDPVIKQLMAGKLEGAAKAFIGTVNASNLPSTGKAAYNVSNLRELIGDKATNQFGQMVFQNIVDKAEANPADVVNTWNKISDQTKNDLFRVNDQKSTINRLMADTKSAAHVQQLARAGLLMVGTKIGLDHPYVGTSLATMLALMTKNSGLKAGTQLLDYVATHPKTWATFRAIGKVGESDAAATAASGIRGAVKGGTAVGLHPQPDQRKALESIQLGNQNPNEGKPLTSLSPDPPADPAAASATSPTDNPVTTATKSISQLPQEVQNATSTIPVQVTQGQQMSDPNNRSSTQTVAANVDQGAGNNTIEINNPQSASDPATMAHELVHVWQNNLPPSTQAKIPEDAKDMSAFDISDADKLRKQGKTLADLPREKAATIVQKYIETKDPKVKAKLKPWVVDMQKTPLSSTMPTAPNATRLNMTPRPPGRPDTSVAGAYPKGTN